MSSDHWWNNFTESSSIHEIELKRKKTIFYVSNYIGGAIVLLFAFKSLSSDNLALILTLFGGGLFIIFTSLLSHFFKNKNIFIYMNCFYLCLIMLGLAYSGGVQNTGLYWVFPFPFILFVMLGYKFGFLVNLIVFFIIMLMLSNQNLIPANYSEVEISRFLFSLSVTILLLLIGEAFRYKSSLEIKTINIDKEREANTDLLTNLPNRRFLDSFFIKNIISCPNENFPLSIIAVDIDHFKKVNDTYGHHVGDIVLQQFAKLLQKHLRKTDVVARTGGEEFVIIFPQTELKDSHKSAEKIRKIVEEYAIKAEEHTIKITASFGIAIAHSEEDLNDAFRVSDNRLYDAKQAGRNQVKSA